MFRHAYGDLWDLADRLEPDAVCITTNGYVKRSGEAVMGKGCALEAATRWPDLPKLYGKILMTSTLHVTPILETDSYTLIAFPVKLREGLANESLSNVVKHQRLHFKPGDIVPGWAMTADLELIRDSAEQLMRLIDQQGWKTVLLPRPGVGNGGLSWDEVSPILARLLDERVIVVHKPLTRF